MKKTYQNPSVQVINVDQLLPIALSIAINNTPTNDVSGDVKEQGDWDIWGGDEE